MTQRDDAEFLFDTLYDIASALTFSLDEDEVLNNIMKLVGELFSPEHWSLLLYNQEKNTLTFRLVVGSETDSLTGTSFPADQGVAGWVLKQRQYAVISDAKNDKRVYNPTDSFHTSSIIAFPLYVKNKPIGVIELINVPVDSFSPNKIRILDLLSQFASIALYHSDYLKSVEKKTTLDPLTGLYNASYMYTILKKEISRFSRTGKVFALIFFDLDHFKSVNDTFGHLVGSELLIKVARLIKKNIRPTDWGIRYGGDEFVIILENADYPEARLVSERIKSRLLSLFDSDDQYRSLRLSASFGVAVYNDTVHTAKDLIEMADRATYRAKESGRNRICLAAPDESCSHRPCLE